MFEIKAEERVKDYIIEKWDCLMKPCKTLEDCRSKDLEFDDAVNLVKDGVEFGYSKANEYAKVIIQDLLDNSDEYARQRAIDFLKEN